MNKLFLSLLFILFSAAAFSQKLYFVYFQTESSQPFYVKMNKKVHSSTSSGYVIIPRLVDSTYSIVIGFPGQTVAEQEFSVSINRKDRGYLVKNFGEKGWGLFDLQSMGILMSATGKSAGIEKTTVPSSNVSLFASMLSHAADDPSLLEKPIRVPPPESKTGSAAVIPAVKTEETEPIPDPTRNNGNVSAKKEEVKTEEVKPPASEAAVVKKDEPVPETKPVITEPTDLKKEDAITEVKPNKEYKRSEVVKASAQDGEQGHDLVFVDTDNDGNHDTIRLTIPNPKTIVALVKDPPKEEKKFLDINAETEAKADTISKEPETTVQKTEAQKTETPETSKKEETAPPITETPKLVTPELNNTAAKSTVKSTETKQPVINTCPEIAQESDFLKLRRKMVAGKDDDEMVMEARRYFKIKCFTVYQVRNLGALFLTDEGKYKFFDAAYRHTSDVHNFISLRMELKEEYYVNRFTAMLR